MPDQPTISEKAVYKAVSNYLTNELGINRQYVENILLEKIEARNPGQLIQQEINKYFHRGPNGWDIERIIKAKTESVINDTVRQAMENGVRAQLEQVIQNHVSQITGQCQTHQAFDTLPVQNYEEIHIEQISNLETQLRRWVAVLMDLGDAGWPDLRIQTDNKTWHIRLANANDVADAGNFLTETRKSITNLLRVSQESIYLVDDAGEMHLEIPQKIAERILAWTHKNKLSEVTGSTVINGSIAILGKKHEEANEAPPC